jgi:hypothetical protein
MRRGSAEALPKEPTVKRVVAGWTESGDMLEDTYVTMQPDNAAGSMSEICQLLQPIKRWICSLEGVFKHRNPQGGFRHPLGKIMSFVPLNNYLTGLHARDLKLPGSAQASQ